LTIYMATAGKSMILLPFVYWGFYVLFGRGRLEALYPVFAGGLVASLALLLVITRPDGIAFLVSSILMYRTIGNGGQLAVAYYDFFSFHQQTDYSHVNLIREFTHPYPYGSNEIGQVIGKFYWNDEVNANASFWATDGIAAMGLPGLAISTVACVTLFVVMNSVTRGYNKLFACLCFIQFVVTMLNASLFSSVWSGGGFFLLLFFLFNKEDPRLLQASGGSSPQTVR